MLPAYVLAERTATLVTLVLLLGAAVFRVLVLGRLRDADGAGALAAYLDAVAKRIAAVAAVTLLALAGVRLHGQVAALFDAWSGATPEALRALLLSSTWGHAWLLSVGASALVAAGVVVGRPLDAWGAVPLAVAAAMNGHAAAVDGVAPVTIAMDALHLLAAGGWAGGVFFLLLAVGLAPERAELLRVVRAFSRVALTCAALLFGTGVIAAWIHLTGPADLVRTPYGVRLSIKLALVAAMAAAGASNWRRATPALAAGDMRPLRRGVALEVFFALAVLTAAARLVITAPPSEP